MSSPGDTSPPAAGEQSCGPQQLFPSRPRDDSEMPPRLDDRDVAPHCRHVRERREARPDDQGGPRQRDQIGERQLLSPAPARCHCTLAVNHRSRAQRERARLALVPPLEHSPDQIASRPAETLSVITVPLTNDADRFSCELLELGIHLLCIPTIASSASARPRRDDADCHLRPNFSG